MRANTLVFKKAIFVYVFEWVSTPKNFQPIVELSRKKPENGITCVETGLIKNRDHLNNPCQCAEGIF